MNPYRLADMLGVRVLVRGSTLDREFTCKGQVSWHGVQVLLEMNTYEGAFARRVIVAHEMGRCVLGTTAAYRTPKPVFKRSVRTGPRGQHLRRRTASAGRRPCAGLCRQARNELASAFEVPPQAMAQKR